MNLIGWKIGLVMYLAVSKSLRIKRTKETYACDRSSTKYANFNEISIIK
jgi:hypothetical protein